MRKVPFILAASLVLALSGCGGSDEKDSAAPATTPTAGTTSAPSPTNAPTVDPSDDLRKAVTSYSDAYLTGDADTGYDLFSKRCKARMSKEEFADLVSQAKDLHGSALPLKTFDAEISGDLARVTYTYDLSAINQDSEPWVREEGQWREDDC